MDILNNIILIEYKKMMKECQNILTGVNVDSDLYIKTVCIMNEISQKIERLKGV